MSEYRNLRRGQHDRKRHRSHERNRNRHGRQRRHRYPTDGQYRSNQDIGHRRQHQPETRTRCTDALSARRDFSAASVACARLSCSSPSAALKTSSPAIISASRNLPGAHCSTIAASSIHGTGAQNFSSAMRHACADVSGMVFGPAAPIRTRASALLRPPACGAIGGLAGPFVRAVAAVGVMGSSAVLHRCRLSLLGSMARSAGKVGTVPCRQPRGYYLTSERKPALRSPIGEPICPTAGEQHD